MPVRVNVTELEEILRITPVNQNILLVGRHGIGKSEILTAHYAARGIVVVPLFLGQMSDPGDLIGLPVRDAARDRTVFSPPVWWPAEGQPVALFLDELNRARPEILQSVHDLALSRRLAGRSLPPGSVVIAAINAGEPYQVTDLDPALASRFNIYELHPEVDEWASWARRAGIDDRVITFIEQNHSLLDGNVDDVLDKSPDRRAWVRVARMIAPHAELTPLLGKAIAGIVGAPAALALSKHMGRKARVTAEDVLFKLDAKVRAEIDRLSLPELAALNRQVLYHLQAEAPKLPLPRKKTAVTNIEAYLQHLRAAGQTEGVADFINLTDKPDLERASGLLLSSPGIMALLTDYIEKVKL